MRTNIKKRSNSNRNRNRKSFKSILMGRKSKSKSKNQLKSSRKKRLSKNNRKSKRQSGGYQTTPASQPSTTTRACDTISASQSNAYNFRKMLTNHFSITNSQ